MEAVPTEPTAVPYTPSTAVLVLTEAVASNNAEAVARVVSAHPTERMVAPTRKRPVPALWWAAREGWNESCRAMLAAGWDPAVAHRSCPALVAAAARSHWAVARALIAGGADVNTVDDQDRTALILAVVAHDVAAVEALLAAGANPNLGWHNNRTPLIEAAYNGGADLCARLLQAGADPHQSDKNGWTALEQACRGGRTDCLRLLLEAVGDPNMIGRNGFSLLSLAVSNNAGDAIALLTRSGADTNRPDPRNSHPQLVLAATLGAEQSVGALLEAGADPLATNRQGQTAEQVARTDAVAHLLRAARERVELTAVAHDRERARPGRRM